MSPSPSSTISPSPPFSPISAVHKGKGYSEPHLKDLLELVLPSLEVSRVSTSICQQWMKSHLGTLFGFCLIEGSSSSDTFYSTGA